VPSSTPSTAGTLAWQCFNAAVRHGELATLNAQPAKKTHVGDVHWWRTAPDRHKKGLLCYVWTYRCSSLANDPHLTRRRGIVQHQGCQVVVTILHERDVGGQSGRVRHSILQRLREVSL